MIIDSVNISEALRYMGQKGTEISDNFQSIISECEKNLLKNTVPKYTYRCFDIEHTESGVAVCNTTLILLGYDIREHLSGCEKAVLMCATIGGNADELIRKLSLSDMTQSFVTDALASALIEQVCDNAEKEISKKFPNMYMTWRFSPGYGDFPIDQQAEFLNVTDAGKRIGLYLSDGGMMIPSKSVTAVMGLSEKPINKKKQSCSCCGMSDRCEFKKRGERCGS